MFDFVCDRRWDELRPAADPAVRQCDTCREAVHYRDTIGVARTHAAAGHCIAVDLGIKRHDGDLSGMTDAVLGRPGKAGNEKRPTRPDPATRPGIIPPARSNVGRLRVFRFVTDRRSRSPGRSATGIL